MAPPPPHPAPATAATAGHPGPQPPPRGLQPSFSKENFLLQMALFGVCFIVVLVTVLVPCFVAPPINPSLKVAGLTVSNLTVAAPTGATWNAALLAEGSWSDGRLFFTEVECFLYYHWDAAQHLAAAPAKPFMLLSTDRTVVKVRMTMGRPEEAAVVEDMDRERRSVGTVVVGLGLRMRVTYVRTSWWKKDCGHIEVRCDDLKIAFANSTTEGSLVTGADIATEDHPAARQSSLVFLLTESNHL